MRKAATTITTAASLAALLGGMAALAPTAAPAQEKSVVQQGKELAFNRKKGNCLACHQVEEGSLPGNAGPPLVGIQARFNSKEELYQQIYDPHKVNPDSFMPPFGRHNILTDEEIRKITEYVWTL